MGGGGGGEREEDLDTTYRRRAATLAGRVLGLMAAVLVVMALPLDFAGALRILRTKFLPGALHAIECSRISFSLLQRLRSAFVSAVWSKKDATSACWSCSVFVGRCRFRLLRWYLAYRSLEVPRWYSLLGLVAGGCPGHGPVHLSVESAGVHGFAWDALNSVWARPGLPVLHHLAGPFQHYKAVQMHHGWVRLGWISSRSCQGRHRSMPLLRWFRW